MSQHFCTVKNHFILTTHTFKIAGPRHCYFDKCWLNEMWNVKLKTLCYFDTMQCQNKCVSFKFKLHCNFNC